MHSNGRYHGPVCISASRQEAHYGSPSLPDWMDDPDDMGEHDGDDDDIPYTGDDIPYTDDDIPYILILCILRHILAQPIWWTG